MLGHEGSECRRKKPGRQEWRRRNQAEEEGFTTPRRTIQRLGSRMGLNSPNKQEDIKLFLKKQGVGLVALVETKVKKENISRVADKLFMGWRWYTNVESNHKVRIWIVWREQGYHMQVMREVEQIVHCKAIQNSTQKHFSISFVYGLNSIAQRQMLWSEMKSIADTVQGA
ncbi:hypothetical protein Cgig2_025078 [Carnegiea gigantea]|uniref:Uncharacterized protein n=1 Tax=Carnegiea gigantea TaxID=171969 RepID=A0A9Q1KJY6_9CARY|nr:hypothetical protein Cgig2_025078 [Carnegiea gigantea]